HELVVFTHLHIRSGFPDHVLAGQAEFLGVSPQEVAMASGTAEEAAAHVKALWSAGANTVLVRPVTPDPLPHVTALLSALWPRTRNTQRSETPDSTPTGGGGCPRSTRSCTQAWA